VATYTRLQVRTSPNRTPAEWPRLYGLRQRWWSFVRRPRSYVEYRTGTPPNGPPGGRAYPELIPIEELGLHPLAKALSIGRKALRPRQGLIRRRQWKVFVAQQSDEVVGPEVARLVALLTDRWGQAPTRSEVRRAMGWSFWQWHSSLRTLTRSGWLRTGIGPRSLRPGTRATG
jgi:hypothetical protein